MIHKCKCTHRYQDRKHGVGSRVFNDTTLKAPEGKKIVRCTVCGTTVEAKK